MERKEPTLGGASPDDHIESAPRKSRPARSAPAPAAPTQGSGFIGGFALLVAVAALGGSGYLAWQLQQAQEELVSADSRIASLEQKLELSDDESSQSVTAIRSKLKWADAEIRKLWGVSYDTNRKSIASQKSQLAKLDKSLSSAIKDLKKASAKAGTAEKKAGDLGASLTLLTQQVNSDKSKYDKAIGGATDQRKQIQNAVDDINRLKQQLAKLNLDLNGRVKDNEEAIDAIDKHRVSVNREIQQIKGQLGNTVP